MCHKQNKATHFGSGRVAIHDEDLDGDVNIDVGDLSTYHPSIKGLK